MDKARSHILVCVAARCVASGALEVSAALQTSLQKHGLADEVTVIETGCLGACAVGPVAAICPDGVFYHDIKPADAEEVVTEHMLKGRVVKRLVYTASSTAQIIPALQDIGFFRVRKKIVLRDCGVTDAASIDEYIARNGYQALAKVLAEMTPDEVVDEIKESGLQGRGGAGFSTGMKWSFTRNAPGEKRYVLCNADEGEPDVFMDHSIIEGDPHSVIEAMAITAYALGLDQGYVYVRAEYPLAVERLGNALRQAREYGLLGRDIMGTGFDFDLEIRMGMQIMVHMGTCGITAGARSVLRALMDELASVDSVTLRQSGCAGLCHCEPMCTMIDTSGQTFRYGNLDKNKVHRIVQEHILMDRPVMDLLIPGALTQPYDAGPLQPE